MNFYRRMDLNRSLYRCHKTISTGFDIYTMSLVILKPLFPYLRLTRMVPEVICNVLSEARASELLKKLYQIWLKLPKEELSIFNVIEKEDFLDRQSLPYIIESILEKADTKELEQDIRNLLSETIDLNLEEARSPLEGIAEQIDELIKIHRLSQVEIKALLFIYTVWYSNDLPRLFGNLDSSTRSMILSKVLNIELSHVPNIFSRDGQLASSGLIHLHERSFPSPTAGLHDFLSGQSPEGLSERYIRLDRGKRYSLRSFNLPGLRLEVPQDILGTKNACNILLYGTAGTGKTEFARSLAASRSRLVFFFTLAPNALFGDEDHRAELIAAQDRVSRENGILIVDEADNILQPIRGLFSFDRGKRSIENFGKEWLNKFLDNSKCRTIWITNRIGMLEPSVKRRFDFSLRFRDLDRSQRLEMWKRKLREENLRLPRSAVKRFATEYPVNSGMIASALKACTISREDPEMLIVQLEEILERQLELYELDKLVDHSATCRGYDPSVLCLDTDRPVFEDSLSGFIKQHESNEKVGGLNLLFWGPPGTGKTEYARYLAGLTGRELIVKRVSDLQNCYLGETEKAIRSAFQEASRSGSILFIDEADSFLYTRDRARESWEITAVNEFLTNMESFTGVLICCTNFFSEFDKASLRRFQWKIGFKPLEAEGRVNLFRQYFAPRKKLAPDLVARLEELDGLVPGDFKAVSDRLSFGKPGRGRRTKELALDELAKEVGLRRGREERVGFDLHSTG